MNMHQIAAATKGCVPVPGHKLQLLSTSTFTSFLSSKAVRQPRSGCQSRKPCLLLTGNMALASLFQNDKHDNLAGRVVVFTAFSGKTHHRTPCCAKDTEVDAATFCQKNNGDSLLTGNAVAGAAEQQVLHGWEKEVVEADAAWVYQPKRQQADDHTWLWPRAQYSVVWPDLAELKRNPGGQTGARAGKKFRLSGVAEIIFKFFKKIPKVIQYAADSLNKGNCNCSDLALKTSFL